LTAWWCLPILVGIGRHRWLIVLVVVVVLIAFGWIALEIWFGLTQAR
jgi:hypothetical protein